MKGADYIKLMQEEAHPSLNDSDLLRLSAKYTNNTDKQDQMRTVLFQYITRHANHFRRDPEFDETRDLIPLYFPEQKGNIDFFYDSIPFEELWRCFVDVQKQRDPSENGYGGYEEREPGSIQAIYDAFIEIKNSMDVPLSSDYILNIHRTAARPCPKQYEPGGGWAGPWSVSIEGYFKSSASGHIDFNASSISPLGLSGMLEDFANLHAMAQKGVFRMHPKHPVRGHAVQMQAHIDQYEQAVLQVEPLAKLKAIVQLCVSLERQHAFKDGNTRTCVTLLLNRELVRHGFSPSILEDPNRFDGYTLNECVTEVIKGMQNFRDLAETGVISGCKSMDALVIANAGRLPIEDPIRSRLANS